MSSACATMDFAFDACLEKQIDELELLSSMYGDGELQMVREEFGLDCWPKQLADYLRFTQGSVSFRLRLVVSDGVVDCDFELPKSYPLERHLDVFVRSANFNEGALNEALRSFVEHLPLGSPQITDVVTWILERAADKDNYSKPAAAPDHADTSLEDAVQRYWIHSHHLRSQQKRRDMLHLADGLGLGGFHMAGKPGVILIEGGAVQCRSFWDQIRRWNWKKLTLRHMENGTDASDEHFLKFDGKYRELVCGEQTRRSGGQNSHMDMGVFLRFLSDRELKHGFALLFGIEPTDSSSAAAAV